MDDVNYFFKYVSAIYKLYYSTWNSINADVPQSSILVPLLFLLFINDIVDVVSNGMKLFADDICLSSIVDGQN